MDVYISNKIIDYYTLKAQILENLRIPTFITFSFNILFVLLDYLYTKFQMI